MTLPDKAEIALRLDRTGRRLEAALAFSRLLAELDSDEETRQLADDAQNRLEEIEENRKELERFAGRRALREAREAEIDCAVLLRRLAARDPAVSPASLRVHLRRGPVRDLHELVNLLGFYVHLEGGPEWDGDRVDKVALLIAQLGQHLTAAESEPDSQRMSELLESSHPTSHIELTELERGAFDRNLAAIQSEVEAADSLSQLIDSGTLKRYRSLKHRLGQLVLHPDLLTALLRTNQFLQRKIDRLSSRTLTGIFSIYQGIFETSLQGKLEPGLRREIDQLSQEFERFERRVKQDQIRLAELEGFWNKLQELAERLNEAAAETVEAEPPTEPSGPQLAAAEEPPEDWLAEDLAALLDLLRESDSKRWPAEFVSFSPREEFQLDSREIVAFRRLSNDEASDRTLEMFLLKAAALRRTIKRSARKLAETADAEIARELPVFAVAKQAVRLADSFLGRYSQAVGQAILDGDVADAQKLQILRMRLVRESAGIWLQVHQPH